MRVIFAGTPDFALIALQALHAAGHTVALVLTQPDRPAGRGLKLQASPVKQYAQAQGWPVSQPHSLRLDGKWPEEAQAARQAIEAADADAMVVAAYGLLLPQWVLDAMRQRPGQYGCINIHGSLLPRWRGAAPIHRAIEAGDSHTGVTLMQMDIGLDTGDMLLAQSVPIGPQDTTATLHDSVAQLGARLLVQALAAPDTLEAQPQPAQGITYAHKIEKHEAAVDWRDDAQRIVRRVRAFVPFPVAHGVLHGEPIKIWAAHVAPSLPNPPYPLGAPGEVLQLDASGVTVATGAGAVVLTELQRPGGKRLAAADWLRGFPLAVGARWDLPAPRP